MKSSALAFVFASAIGATVALVSCDKADDALDCNQICDKYKECLGGNSYDESDCRTRCRDKADDKEFTASVDQCAECVSDDKSCVENTFSCATKCAGVVP